MSTFATAVVCFALAGVGFSLALSLPAHHAPVTPTCSENCGPTQTISASGELMAQLRDDPCTAHFLCGGNKGSAAFTIGGATGVLAGLVVLPGSVRATIIMGVPGDSAQYRATIVP